MRKTIFALLASLALVLGLGVSGAAANDSRSCTLSGGTAYLAAYGSGTILNQVRINSTPELNQSQSHWTAYSDITGAAVASGSFVADRVDGDGYWNYKWSRTTNLGGVDRVYVSAVQRSNGSTCGSSLYF